MYKKCENSLRLSWGVGSKGIKGIKGIKSIEIINVSDTWYETDT